MYGKLLKYENKALSKTILPIGIATMFVAVFGSAMLKLNLIMNRLVKNGSVLFTLKAVTTTFFAISVIAMISAVFVAGFMLMQRYYRNLFTDEGYLTFTLPVKTEHILLSKLTSAVIWGAFVVVCSVAAVFIIVLFGTTPELVNHKALEEIVHFVQALFKIDFDINGYLIFAQTFITLILSVVEQYLMIYLAITLGNQVAKKHKVLGAIGMYFVVYAVCQAINSVVLVIFGLSIGGIAVLSGTGEAAINWMLGLTSLLSVGYILAFFFINNRIIKTRLNLE